MPLKEVMLLKISLHIGTFNIISFCFILQRSFSDRSLLLHQQQRGRGLLLGQLDIQENNNASNIINNAFLLFLPAQVTFSHHGFRSLFSIFLFKVGLNNLGDFFVMQKFPNTITCNHDEFVIFAEVQFKDFYR